MSDFKSSFASDLSNMIELKVSLGGSTSTYLPRAKAFDAFCFAKHRNAGGLSKALALDWLKESMPSGNSVVNSNAAFLRGFAFYLNSIGKEAYRIPDRYMTGRDIFVPHIFTDTEMRNIFSAIDHFRYPRNPLLPFTLSTYFRLTYTCGLHPMEGRELKRSDVDLRTGEIQIVNSKRHRSRIQERCIFTSMVWIYPSCPNGSAMQIRLHPLFTLMQIRSTSGMPLKKRWVGSIPA